MRLIIDQRAGARRRVADVSAIAVRHTLDDVLDIIVEPVDQANRTQAERNAQNALDAAKLARTLAVLEDVQRQLATVPDGAKVRVNLLRERLAEAVAAPVR